MLILCTGNLDLKMHWCVALTKVMEILLLTYPHVLEYGCCHFFARHLAILFRVSAASTSSKTLAEGKSAKKRQRSWSQTSMNFVFVALGAS